jgi:uncharacterized damage-inducible protein DinB
MSEIIDLRYPIGKLSDQKFNGKEPFNEDIKDSLILDIQYCPNVLEQAVTNLDTHQLETPYREDGWTIKQVIHHVADSHMNAYMRFKLGLTENNPTIKTYEEAAWANLDDTSLLPINISLTLLHALHTRWVTILKSMDESDWQRTVFHPGHKKEMTLWSLLAMYAWHGKHHIAHITSLRERNGWN